VDRLSTALWSQFKIQRDEYLSLLREAEEAKAQVNKSAERIRLLRKLLALEGMQVGVPTELDDGQRLATRRRGKAA
jgi:hypothetical protein